MAVGTWPSFDLKASLLELSEKRGWPTESRIRANIQSGSNTGGIASASGRNNGTSVRCSKNRERRESREIIFAAKELKERKDFPLSASIPPSTLNQLVTAD